VNGSHTLPFGFAMHSATQMVEVLRFATDALHLIDARRAMVRGAVVRYSDMPMPADPLPDNAKMIDSETRRERA